MRGEVRPNLRIFLQDEHNLVLPGGRGVPGDCPVGVIPSMFGKGETYLCRVTKAHQLPKVDVIAEYNLPNIINIKTCGAFPPEICERLVYAPPLPFPYYNEAGGRGINLLTNFVNTAEPRRARIMERLYPLPGYQNVQSGYDLPSMRAMYRGAKIVLNSHQTRYDHTIEEFRVLPALSQGCVIVSEDVPLRTEIPYHEYIIWCTYEDLPAVAAETLENYDEIFQRVHGPQSRLPELLNSLLADFEASMDRVLALPAVARPGQEKVRKPKLTGWQKLRNSVRKRLGLKR